jgi:hypothetical protein
VNHDADDAAHTTFVRLRRSRSNAGSDELVLSRAAMHLHTFGVLSSIETGSPGFVSDRYLGAISAETSITALELCLAGLWERTSCGYRVSDADTLSVAEQIHGQLNDLAARCTRNGGHIVDPQHPDVCAKCGSILGMSTGPQLRSHPGAQVRSEIEYRPRHRSIDGIDSTGGAAAVRPPDDSGKRADAADAA